MFYFFAKILIGFSFTLIPLTASAHEEALHGHETDLIELLNSLATTSLTVVAIWVGLLVLISLTRKKLEEHHKQELFWGMAAPVVLVSLLVAGTTVYENSVAVTKGPVHWHADFRIFNCGEEIDLAAPQGISNKIGTADFHEHDDGRVHVEGTVVELADVSLSRFFSSIGGQASLGRLVIPTDHGLVELTDRERCPAEAGEQANRLASLQVFLYRTEENKVYQEKLHDWSDYVLSPEQQVPPGDCVIFEFTPELKNQTDKICQFYEIELGKGNLEAANFDFKF